MSPLVGPGFLPQGAGLFGHEKLQGGGRHQPAHHFVGFVAQGLAPFLALAQSPLLEYQRTAASALASFTLAEENKASLVRQGGLTQVLVCALYEDLQVVRDWSYSAQTYHGPGHILVGDAACFVDPILAGGVDFAIRGAANAAVAVMEALTGNADALNRYSETMRKDYQAWLRMARYWYGNNRSVDGFFWEAHQLVQRGSVSTPLRAFVYLTSGHYAADAHFKVFQEWQEKKMFQALGVNHGELKSALAQRRGGAAPRTK